MDWEKELGRLETLIRSSPEKNRRALAEFLTVSEHARTDDTLEALLRNRAAPCSGA